jgi:hypothetical protein
MLMQLEHMHFMLEPNQKILRLMLRYSKEEDEEVMVSFHNAVANRAI